ncbi:MAG: hypothetical protein JOZ65_26945, partial [Chloroflexi bacterium]|nr:hypothetical protein [Chloroflexota bacterium]
FTSASGNTHVQIVWNQADTTSVPYTLPGTVVAETDATGNTVPSSGNTISIGAAPLFITYAPAPTPTSTPTLTPSPTATATPTASPIPTFTPTAVPTQTGGDLLTMLSSPARLADTRLSGGAIASGSFRCFHVAGVAGIPSDAGAVVLNITAVGYTANGWLTAYPSGQAVPATSTLNFGTSQYAMANGSIVRVGSGGQVCVNIGTSGSSSNSANVILDATGFAPAAALSQMPMLSTPVRVADTRLGGGAITSGTTQCFQVGGLSAIPSDASAVMLNVTAVGFATDGWLTVFPNGQPVPGTSTLNFSQSEYAVANNAIVRIGNGGQVCVYVGTLNSAPGGSQVIFDATGYLTSAGISKLSMLGSPQRVLDTRLSTGAIASGSFACFQVAGQAGIPVSARAVAANVTAVGYTAPGWLTVYPSGQSAATSTLNFDTSEYGLANGAVLALGGDGRVCVQVGTTTPGSGTSQVILDIVGYLSH